MIVAIFDNIAFFFRVSRPVDRQRVGKVHHQFHHRCSLSTTWVVLAGARVPVPTALSPRSLPRGIPNSEPRPALRVHRATRHTGTPGTRLLRHRRKPSWLR